MAVGSRSKSLEARFVSRQLLCLLAIAATGLTCCSRAPEEVAQSISGSTMGTTYQIRYASVAADPELAASVDSLLEEINASVSTYIESALISRINAGRDPSVWHPLDPHFAAVFERSREVHRETGGAFDPAIGALVDLWGFGPGDTGQVPDSTVIDQLLAASDLDAFIWRPDPPALRKQVPDARLDFSAIAKGYAVDAVGMLLEANGIDNYMVEIGGEVRTRGAHPSGRGWRVAIERATETATEPGTIQTILALNDAALATSGSYRNYYEVDGRRYAHILDPETGYPQTSDVLSATVLASDCMTADAYATAFMVMGLREAIALVESREDLEAYFIVSDQNGGYRETASQGFAAFIAQ